MLKNDTVFHDNLLEKEIISLRRLVRMVDFFAGCHRQLCGDDSIGLNESYGPKAVIRKLRLVGSNGGQSSHSSLQGQ
jgi:hypothetical protein